MRIVHVLHSHGYGGAENHVLLLMKAQRDMGHEVLYAGPSDGWLAQRCREACLDVSHLRMAGLADVFSVMRLRRLVKRWQADVVHGHLVRASHYAGLAAWRMPDVAAVATAHATTAHRHMERCRHIIAVSEAVRRSLEQHGESPARISVVYNGVPDIPEAEVGALRAELGITPDTLALVNAGRFVRDKGQDLLVRALKHCGEDVRLYLIGDTATPYGQTVRELCAGDPRVVFLGYRSDVPRLLAAFDGYVLGSRREALGLSLVEAAAARLPSVATAVGGVPEVVIDGISGHLVAPEDPQSIAAGIERLRLGGAGARRRMGAAAREHYLRHFTLQRMAKEVISTYEAVLDGAP